MNKTTQKFFSFLLAGLLIGQNFAFAGDHAPSSGRGGSSREQLSSEEDEVKEHAANFKTRVDAWYKVCRDDKSSKKAGRLVLRLSDGEEDFDCSEEGKLLARELDEIQNGGKPVEEANSCPGQKPGLDIAACVGGVACNAMRTIMSLTVLPRAFMSLVEMAPENRRKVPACLSSTKSDCATEVIAGVLKDLWSTVTAVWDIGKWALGGVVSSLKWAVGLEDKTSDAMLMAGQQSEGLVSQFIHDPIGFIGGLPGKMLSMFLDFLKDSFMCAQWSGAPHLSTCLKPLKNWSCATCDQTMNLVCGIAGVAGGEVLTFMATAGIGTVITKAADAGKFAALAAKIQKIPGVTGALEKFGALKAGAKAGWIGKLLDSKSVIALKESVATAGRVVGEKVAQIREAGQAASETIKTYRTAAVEAYKRNIIHRKVVAPGAELVARITPDKVKRSAAFVASLPGRGKAAVKAGATKVGDGLAWSANVGRNGGNAVARRLGWEAVDEGTLAAEKAASQLAAHAAADTFRTLELGELQVKVLEANEKLAVARKALASAEGSAADHLALIAKNQKEAEALRVAYGEKLEKEYEALQKASLTPGKKTTFPAELRELNDMIIANRAEILAAREIASAESRAAAEAARATAPAGEAATAEGRALLEEEEMRAKILVMEQEAEARVTRLEAETKAAADAANKKSGKGLADLRTQAKAKHAELAEARRNLREYQAAQRAQEVERLKGVIAAQEKAAQEALATAPITSRQALKMEAGLAGGRGFAGLTHPDPIESEQVEEEIQRAEKVLARVQRSIGHPNAGTKRDLTMLRAESRELVQLLASSEATAAETKTLSRRLRRLDEKVTEYEEKLNESGADVEDDGSTAIGATPEYQPR